MELKPSLKSSQRIRIFIRDSNRNTKLLCTILETIGRT
ncbi:hypothetical protein LEP1GSC173_4176 [Leptospira interrogans str. HAI1594]|uniref:Uncharacterized protein n=1 Tax=Leptospira interrogans str. UI 12758 TaxID=1049938 RepID=A0A0E2D0G2_LEPIR|nr:hypothetical protein LEP1GSC057_0409 [Leptospira interrogans str. Brem 329]EKP21459.1 hypothetical protein LEP1GSC117_1288 [Leptospira interrogans serovar Icterohaemorrhagiae str. Verdun LP]EKP74344.1 hypothetical protein LEP1GSC173_4176 [Leptospira interrogans str. HAI1594]EKP86592.1 hypothetical protein LEP1GSC020_2776 [Leptospira interrogans serovar Grippotyphosa str. 2006006986]EKR17440.1 hypothetical protein LEP1GSC019_1839 [Leptospira interrogans serovar Pyrogenes str. 2006006960]EKR3